MRLAYRGHEYRRYGRREDLGYPLPEEILGEPHRRRGVGRKDPLEVAGFEVSIAEAAKILILDDESRNIPVVFFTASVLAEGIEEIGNCIK